MDKNDLLVDQSGLELPHPGVSLGGEEDYKSVVYEDDDGLPPAEEPEEAGPQKKPSIVNSYLSLPTALSRLVTKNLLAFLGLALVAIIVFVSPYRTFSLFLALTALWVFWNGLSIVLDYRAGRIIERVLICSGAVSVYGTSRAGQLLGRRSKRCKVSFQDTNEELPSFYQYTVTARTTDFIISGVYVTYVRSSTPQLLLAYLLL